MNAPDTLADALRDRYRLEEEIGRGGMAIVYRARDLRHGRDVAIKVLRPEVASAIGPDRFLREIELAAGLTHANILPVFDSGEADGALYFVMPCVEGETLRARLEREGRLPVDEAIRIAREIADGLEYAHGRGIVHRDVKPANILLSDGHAYVMDFGIARAVGPEAEDRLTQTGLAVGTPAYMSPEQAAGEREIDARSDVYALGCLLYEMLSGDLPFAGDTPQAVLVKRLTEDPEPVRARRRDVPSDVERAVARALARDPKSRFASAGPFRDALGPAAHRAARWSVGSAALRLAHWSRRTLRPHPVLVPVVAMVLVAGAAAGAWWLMEAARDRSRAEDLEAAADGGPVRLAVLPIETVAGDVDDYAGALGAGLTRQLSAVDDLAVPSRHAVAALSRENLSPDSVARALDVAYVIESTLAGFGDSLRIDLDLVDVAAGWTIVSHIREEAPRGEVVSLADTVARRVGIELRTALGREFRPRELRSQTSDSEAWLLVYEAERLREAAVDSAAVGGAARDRALALVAESDSLLEAASRRDAEWAEIPVQAGWNDLERALAEGEEARAFGPEDDPDLRAALAEADRALGLDSTNSDALALRGRALGGLAGLSPGPARRDSLYAEAERDLSRAIDLEPGHVEALYALGLYRRQQGDSRAALDLLNRAYRSDRWYRFAPDLLSRLAEIATDVDMYDSARAVIAEGRRRWPQNPDFAALSMLVETSVGTDVERAWALADTVSTLYTIDRADPYQLILQAQVASVIARSGLEDSARAVLDRAEARARAVDEETYTAYDFAHARLVLGDTIRALDWLELDLEHYPESRAIRATEAWFRPLHGNPRFEALVGGAADADGGVSGEPSAP